MKQTTWLKHHRVLGLILCLFLILFCASGVVMNHRKAFANSDLSRSILPSQYAFNHWNNGLLRGTIQYRDSVLIYGNGGIYIADTLAVSIDDYNQGLPTGADNRTIRRIVLDNDGTPWAAALFGVFRFVDGQWTATPIDLALDERLSDIAFAGDTLVALGRSYAYVYSKTDNHFERIDLPKSPDYDGSVTLFKNVWRLHSGELFGSMGKGIVDLIAVIFILLALSGLTVYIIRHFKREWFNAPLRATLRLNALWHNKIGRWTIVLTLLVAATGWCLRPPLMVPLVMNRTADFSTVSEGNWHDKLRMLLYDATQSEWLLHTSEGFFSFKAIGDEPRKIVGEPPISVMGLNVLQFDKHSGMLLCGSFSGMYCWDRARGIAVDFFTGEMVDPQASRAPFGRAAVSGYSSDFKDVNPKIVVEYGAGTDAIAQPEELAALPMSLWNLALEVHTGRLIFGNAATYFYIFIFGGGIVWMLIAGYMARRKRKKKLHNES